LQAVLNRKEKEELVIQLYQQGKTMREIAAAVHMSFGDIGAITKRIIDQNGIDIDAEIKDLKNKSKDTQALYLFSIGKTPLEVKIELDISTNEVHELQEEFWELNQLHELAFVYSEIRSYLPSFLKLFRCLKQRRMLSEKHISDIVEYAGYEFPQLTDRIQFLTNSLIHLESQKRNLMDKIVL
jgi:hypothetical protein